MGGISQKRTLAISPLRLPAGQRMEILREKRQIVAKIHFVFSLFPHFNDHTIETKAETIKGVEDGDDGNDDNAPDECGQMFALQMR